MIKDHSNRGLQNLYFVQWNLADESYFRQFETKDFLKVINKIENEMKEKVESIEIFKTGEILLNFDYMTFWVTTKMEKLIDCEVL